VRHLLQNECSADRIAGCSNSQQPTANSQKYRIKELTMSKQAIQTESAPAAIGTYSQAIRAGQLVFLSGQIPLDPATGTVVDGDITSQIRQVMQNLTAVAEAAGGSLDSAVRIGVFLTNLEHFPLVNQVMSEFFQEPYPARAAVGVKSLPRDVQVEMDAILFLE
jgi:reactive intermediate/imine deaminase